MKLQSNKFWPRFALLIGLTYPFFVYFGYEILPSWLFVLVGGGLLAVRFLGYRNRINTTLLWGGLCAMMLILGGLFIRTEMGAVQAYPILVSLSVAAYFLYSIFQPPTIIERIARKIDPDLTPDGVLYTQRVTWVWVSFLLFNASISFASALWGSMEQWLLWNGLVSYLLMGIVFMGEYCVRRFIRS